MYQLQLGCTTWVRLTVQSHRGMRERGEVSSCPPSAGSLSQWTWSCYQRLWCGILQNLVVNYFWHKSKGRGQSIREKIRNRINLLSLLLWDMESQKSIRWKSRLSWKSRGRADVTAMLPGSASSASPCVCVWKICHTRLYRRQQFSVTVLCSPLCFSLYCELGSYQSLAFHLKISI